MPHPSGNTIHLQQPDTIIARVSRLTYGVECGVQPTQQCWQHGHPVKGLGEVAKISTMAEATVKKAYSSVWARREEVLTPAFRKVLLDKGLELEPLMA